MGEFSDKIINLSDSEMSDIWTNITNYQNIYIDDFLTELKNRGFER
jgi:hypothetical protein